jgi:hypothetical protein
MLKGPKWLQAAFKCCCKYSKSVVVLAMFLGIMTINRNHFIRCHAQVNIKLLDSQINLS